MKKVYILLTRTQTSIANAIYKVTKGKYTHTSITLQPTTTNFHSFARTVKWTFLIAGYVNEDTHTFVFAKYQHCPCGLFVLEVCDEAYAKMETIIDNIRANKKKFHYNFLGLISNAFKIKIEGKNRYNCSQFVAMVLHESGAVKLPLHPALMRPMDFLKIDGIRQIYDGTIGECNFDEDEEL
jgi:hypothetical protein